MDKEIKHPSIERPEFAREAYDYRNLEKAAEYCGVGEAGKVGSRKSDSIEAMPGKSKTMGVPRDHAG